MNWPFWRIDVPRPGVAGCHRGLVQQLSSGRGQWLHLLVFRVGTLTAEGLLQSVLQCPWVLAVLLTLGLGRPLVGLTRGPWLCWESGWLLVVVAGVGVRQAG